MSTSTQEHSGWMRYAPWILLAFIVIFPLIFPSRYLLRTMVNIFFFAALGCAWNIIGGYAGQLSWTRRFLAMGAYPTALLLLGYNIPPMLGFIPGVVVAVVMAFLLGHMVFGLRGPYLALPPWPSGRLFGSCFSIFATKRGISGGDDSFQGTDAWKIAVRLRTTLLLYLPGVAGLCLYVTYKVHGSRLGYYSRPSRKTRTRRKTGHRPGQQQSQGPDDQRGVDGSAGAFYVSYFYYIDPDSVCGTDLSIKILLVAIIGGVGTSGAHRRRPASWCR